MTRPKMLDLFCGEGGAAMGYHRAGFDVVGIDTDPKRLDRYPFESHQADALVFLAEHGHEFDAVHASPPCQGYSRGTAALPDRLDRYDRLIAATRDMLVATGLPYVVENVEDAAPELRAPLMLCGTEFGLAADDTDGRRLALKRHRLFESNVHLLGAGGCLGHSARTRRRVAGVYGGARRDEQEAREVRKGGYVPASLDVLRNLIGAPWMTEQGCFLSIPPAYSQHIGEQLLNHLTQEIAA